MLGKRLKQRRQELGLSQVALADKANIKQGVIGNLERRNSKASEYAPILAKALGVRLEWLTSGIEPMLNDNKIKAYDIKAYEDLSELATDGNDYVIVPEYDVLLSAGTGAYAHEFIETKYELPFRLDWLKQKSNNPNAVKMLSVKGSSMLPILADKDKVLIDTSITKITNGNIYALVVGNEQFIKRLEIDYKGNLNIISDNKDFETKIIPKEDLSYIKIIGEVFHRETDFGLKNN